MIREILQLTECTWPSVCPFIITLLKCKRLVELLNRLDFTLWGHDRFETQHVLGASGECPVNIFWNLNSHLC
jgi:hypothetical protein